MVLSCLEYLFDLEIFMFLCYVNEESDDIIRVGGSTKTVQHAIKNIRVS